MPGRQLPLSPPAHASYDGAYAHLISDDEHCEGDAPDTHRNAPQPDPVCLHGLVGEVARAGSEGTEANPYAIAANFMAFMSCAIGRGPYLPIGNTWHHARLYVLHIGRSGRGRKGDAVSLVNRLDTALRQLRESAAPPIHRGGLSSREGLVVNGGVKGSHVAA